MKRYEILSALFTHSSKVIFSYSYLGDNRAWFPSKYWISGERQGMEKKKNCEVDTYEEKEFHFVDIMLNFFTLDMSAKYLRRNISSENNYFSKLTQLTLMTYEVCLVLISSYKKAAFT